MRADTGREKLNITLGRHQNILGLVLPVNPAKIVRGCRDVQPIVLGDIDAFTTTRHHQIMQINVWIVLRGDKKR